jgi:hypothetical protein
MRSMVMMMRIVSHDIDSSLIFDCVAYDPFF